MPVIFHMHVGTSEHPPHHKSIDVIFLRSACLRICEVLVINDHDVSDLPPSAMVTDFQIDIESLRQLTANFLQNNTYKICSFYELKPMWPQLS